MKLVDKKDMSIRKYSQSKLAINGSTKEEKEKKESELRRFAEIVIGERIEFCQKYKKDEPFDKCVCESVARYLRLFRESHTKTTDLKEKLDMIEVVFEEMKKSGKIKCT